MSHSSCYSDKFYAPKPLIFLEAPPGTLLDVTYSIAQPCGVCMKIDERPELRGPKGTRVSRDAGESSAGADGGFSHRVVADDSVARLVAGYYGELSLTPVEVGKALAGYLADSGQAGLLSQPTAEIRLPPPDSLVNLYRRGRARGDWDSKRGAITGKLEATMKRLHVGSAPGAALPQAEGGPPTLSTPRFFGAADSQAATISETAPEPQATTATEVQRYRALMADARAMGTPAAALDLGSVQGPAQFLPLKAIIALSRVLSLPGLPSLLAARLSATLKRIFSGGVRFTEESSSKHRNSPRPNTMRVPADCSVRRPLTRALLAQEAVRLAQEHGLPARNELAALAERYTAFAECYLRERGVVRVTPTGGIVFDYNIFKRVFTQLRGAEPTLPHENLWAVRQVVYELVGDNRVQRIPAQWGDERWQVIRKRVRPAAFARVVSA